MSFKEWKLMVIANNRYVIGRIVILIFLLNITLVANSQTSSLTIHTSSNESKIKLSKSYSKVTEISNGSNRWKINKDSVSILLKPGGISNNLVFNDFNFHLRPVDRIQSVKLHLEGYANRKIKDNIVQFFLGNQAISGNKANKNLKGKSWPEISGQGIWTYYFDIDPQFYNELSTDSFGVKISLRNIDLDTALVVIKSAKIEINYYPLFTFCQNELITFFVDKPGIGFTYNWKFPDGVKITSALQNKNIINVIFEKEDFGYKNIFVKAVKNDEIFEGEKIIQYNDCRISSISGNIWLDNNCNQSKDSIDMDIGGIKVNISNSIDLSLNGITNQNGIFNFDSLKTDYYKLKFLTDGNIRKGDTLLSLISDNLYSTGEIFLKPGITLDTLSYGFVKKLKISGQIWNDDNANVVIDTAEYFKADSLRLVLRDALEVLQTIDIDSFGRFVFNDILPGDYQICIDSVQDYNIQGQENKNCIGVKLNCGVDIDSLDIGIYKNGSISGKIWLDENENGIRETVERSLGDMKMLLLDRNGNILDSIYTDSLGNYFFNDLKPDGYKLRVDIPEVYDLTFLNFGNAGFDNDFIKENGIGQTGVIFLLSEEKKENIDCGFVYKRGSIGDFVWLDLNENGLQDSDEIGINGIKLKLFNEKNELIEQISSFGNNNTDGYYIFENVKYGKYFIEVTLPDEYKITKRNIIDNSNNNDIDKLSLQSELFNLDPGEKYLDLDIGLVRNYGNIENYVWSDLNENGLQDAGETGIEGIKLSLTDAGSGEIVSEKVSNNEGKIHFKKIIPGNYFLSLDTLQSKYVITSYKVGTNQESDSDFKTDGDYGKTEVFNLEPGALNGEIDLGLKLNYGYINGFVWNDENKNGVYETGEKLLANVEIQLFDNINQSSEPVYTVFSNSDGSFGFEHISEGKYYIKFIQNTSYYTLNTAGGENSITDFFGTGTTDEIDIKWGESINNINGAYVANRCEIGDFTWFDDNKNGLQDPDEKGIGGIDIKLYDLQGFLISETVSDNEGNYVINDIIPGKYFLVFKADGSLEFTIPKLNEEKGSKVLESGDAGITNVFELLPGEKKFDLDAGFVSNLASIGGRIWIDGNVNGVIDAGEELLYSTGVELYDDGDNLVKTVISDSQGRYLFDQLDEGDYFIKLENIPDTLDYAPVLGKISDITGHNGINSTDMFSLETGQSLVNFDFGFVKKKGRIGDWVWLDENGNGLQDSTEQGLNDVKIILYDRSGIELQQTLTTNKDGQAGFYYFDVDPGNYFIRFLIPFIYETTDAEVGYDKELDSDLTGKFGYNTTDIIYVAANMRRTDIDAGIRLKRSSVGGRVWLDTNNDGIMNIGESGIDSIVVGIYNYQDVLIDSTATITKNSKKGNYEFNNLVPGEYYIVFEIPEKYSATKAHKTNNIYIDSDVTGANGNGSTDIFELQPGENNHTFYAGLVEGYQSEISGRVWIDKDKNGLMDIKEKGLNEVEVRLYNLNGVLQDTTLTSRNPVNDKDGYYSFNNVAEGKYYIQFINQIGYFFTQAKVGNNDSINSDVLSVIDIGATDTIIIIGDIKIRNINAGLTLDNHSAIGDRVWEDLNGNGLQDDGEPGINGALVQLYRKDKGVIGSVLTEPDEETGEPGYYLFDNLHSGEYYIKINIPGAYYLTKPDQSVNDDIDSDINDGNGFNTSDYFYLGVNERKNNVDVGAFRLGEVGDYVWLDDNENGIQEPGEEGQEFIFISIYDEEGNNVGTEISDRNGNYRSNSLIPGKYYLKVLGYSAGSFTISNNGDDKYDSDITNEFGKGTSSLFQILSGQFNRDVDIGIIPGSQINLTTFPNPVNDRLQLSFNTLESKNVRIIISNIRGEKIKEINLVSHRGTNILDINFSDIRDGYYSVSLEIENRIAEMKGFLKLK
jgi:hypothetical protein